MNKEEVLRMFLEDDLVVQKGYLKPGEASQFKWTDRPESVFIEALRIAIIGESSGDSQSAIERKINQLFNRQL